MLVLIAGLLTLASIMNQACARAVSPRASSGIAELIVLGDSYSDNCNAWRISNAAQARYPFPACPPAPTGRASGGAQWTDYISNRTSLKVHNYASSGATCNNRLFPRTISVSGAGSVPNPSVADQVRSVAASINGSYGPGYDAASSVALIYIGTNDAIFFVGRLQDNRSTDVLPSVGTSTNDMAGCVLRQIADLYALGIRNFVAMDMIPLQNTPLFSQNTVPSYGGYQINQDGRLISAFMTQLVLARNGLVTAKLDALRTQLPDATIKTFDTYNFFERIFADPSAAGFGPNGTALSSCQLCPGPQATRGSCTVCADPGRYVFYDQLHPGEKAGELLADAISSFISEW